MAAWPKVVQLRHVSAVEQVAERGVVVQGRIAERDGERLVREVGAHLVLSGPLLIIPLKWV